MSKTQLTETALTKAMREILAKENARMVVARTTYSKGEDLAAKEIYEKGRSEATMFCIGEIIALFSKEKEDMQDMAEYGHAEHEKWTINAESIFDSNFTQYKTNSNG